MVSAKAGVGPASVSNRTETAAPVKSFTPCIPKFPFILTPGSCPRAGLPSTTGVAAPPQHRTRSSATELPESSSRWKLFTCSIPATLLIRNGILTGFGPSEDEGSGPFQPRKDRGCGVEQRPMAEFAVAMGHDHGPRRLGFGGYPHQTTAVLELPEQPL